MSSDSAGVPWGGRTLPPGGFSGDDGTADADLSAALAAVRAGLADDRVVVQALALARLLVPIVAVLGEAAEPVAGGAHGGDKGADMALVTLAGPDGRRALPVFSSVAALAAGDSTARPVPVEARRAAVSAVAEGCDLMVLDPAGPTTYVVSRPAMWALGSGREWRPAHHDDDVRAAIGAAVGAEPDVEGFEAVRGAEAELQVVLSVRAGLDAEQVRATAQRVADALQASDVVRERVDGLELRVRSAS